MLPGILESSRRLRNLPPLKKITKNLTILQTNRLQIHHLLKFQGIHSSCYEVHEYLIYANPIRTVNLMFHVQHFLVNI